MMINKIKVCSILILSILLSLSCETKTVEDSMVDETRIDTFNDIEAIDGELVDQDVHIPILDQESDIHQIIPDENTVIPADEDSIEEQVDDVVIDDNEQADADDVICKEKIYDTTSQANADRYCCLCKDCQFEVPDRTMLIVNRDAQTCNDLILEMTNPENGSKPGSQRCYDLQNKYRDVCCNPDCTPPEIDVDWDPVSSPYSQGQYSTCHLCGNTQFPTKPYTITAIAGVEGNPTCENLYWMGRTGNIEDRICYPLQLYMQEPCGCAPPHQTTPETACDLCKEGNYPLRPSTELRNFGFGPNTTCKDVYWKGREGTISNETCERLQQEAIGPCGCLVE